MDWIYYNHAMVPTTPPHETPDMIPIENRSIWEIRGGKPLLARWTTNFDCGFETGWWYCIKDTPFDASKLNSKKRYEINKGKKNFDVKVIDPIKYVDEIYEVTIAAYESWPEKYRPSLDEGSFKASIEKWEDKRILGAFTKNDGLFAGYAYLTEHDNYIEFNMLRVIPKYERLAINAAIVNGILELYNDKICHNFYILDGARSISHETAFQDYLEKYFEFRKAYCRLNIKYNSGVGLVVKILYFFRNVLRKLDSVSMIHSVNSILKMEEIVRKQ